MNKEQTVHSTVGTMEESKGIDTQGVEGGIN